MRISDWSSDVCSSDLEGWLPQLLAAMADGHAVVTPLILEREGVDRGAALRNHLYTGELRVVDVEDTPYLIEHKQLRRAELPDIPNQRSTTGNFKRLLLLYTVDFLRPHDSPPTVITKQ